MRGGANTATQQIQVPRGTSLNDVEADNSNDFYGRFLGQIDTHLHQGITGSGGRLCTISYRP